MDHLIEFATAFTADVEVSPKHRLEQVRIRQGDRLQVTLLPHVLETTAGPVEVADILLPDGTLTRNIPFSCFRFVD